MEGIVISSEFSEGSDMRFSQGQRAGGGLSNSKFMVVFSNQTDMPE